MSSYNNRGKDTLDALDRATQEEHRRIREKNRNENKQRAIETRRKIIAGGIVVKYFPTVMELQPKLKQTDTDREFAGLEEFISTVANDPKYEALFQGMVCQNK